MSCSTDSVAGAFFITPHAVKRYQERCCGVCDYNVALGELIKITSSAHFVKKTNDDFEVWRTGKPLRMRFIVSRKNRGLPQVVTVLNGMSVKHFTKWKTNSSSRGG